VTSVPRTDDELTEEDRRLEELQRYAILDTPPEQPFERITALAARILDTPISLISFIDRDRQWFKSCFGWDERQTSRDISFCTHVLGSAGPLVVPDATQDARFSNNPLVTNDPYIRFYAGAPLSTSDGQVLGTLCVLDTKPRGLTKDELDTLVDLAAVAVDELELRRSLTNGRDAETTVTEALARAREAEDERRRFLSSMSHELRTPLNAILGFGQLLQAEDLQPEQKEDVDEIVGAARRLLALLNELFEEVAKQRNA